MDTGRGTEPAADLGARLRAERQRHGLTLRALAEQVGVSASAIWQIETGKSRPSVSTLYALTTALGLPLEEAFAPTAGEQVHVPPGVAGGGLTEAAVAGGAVTAVVAGAAEHRLGPLVGPADRQCLALDSGVTWERLGQLPGRSTDFLLITYPPGAASSSSGGLMRHAGHEYGYVTAGELVLTLGFEELHLGGGDAVSFESSTPHRYRNDGTEPAVGIWFVAD